MAGMHPSLPADRTVTVRVGQVSYQMTHAGGRVGHFLDAGRPYEGRLLDDIRRRNLHGTALDVGAQIGNHSVYLAAVCGLHVVAVEPDPVGWAYLRRNTVGHDVDCLNIAAYDSETTGRIDAKTKTLTAPGGPIVCRPLDNVLALDDLAVVKADVEGTEPQALTGTLGMIDRCGPVVYAETHTTAAKDAISDVLGRVGYRWAYDIRMGSTMGVWER